MPRRWGPGELTMSSGIKMTPTKDSKGKVIKQTIEGGNGIDQIVADSWFTTSDSSVQYVIVAGNGADVVQGSSRKEIIWGDGNGNTGTTDNGADLLKGGAGNDEIHGGNAADEIHGDQGADNL